MSSTDDRIVKMSFDNASFKKEAIDTQKALADVNKSVDSAGKGKGLLDLSSNMQQVGVTASKMSIITTTALATIANKATNVALGLAKSLTLDPIKQGFTEYESLLTTQNTIMNATGKSAKEVKGYLNQLNHYSDQTIYSFGNMTQSVQKFVNAGVPLPKAVVSIKGIANAAAFAGASSEEANRAMYAFSQSMSLGFIQLQDWNQIEAANLGTQEFKTQLLLAGEAAGTLTKKGKGFVTASGTYVTATKGWRDGLQDQWATTEVLNTALGKYADTSTKLGKKAFAAAQDVRTFSAFMDTLKESIGSGWSAIFTALIGNLGQATKFWSGLSNAIGGAVKTIFNFGAKTLKVWRHMGGFEKTIQGFKNILAPFGAILHAIGDAWSAAFPDSGKGAGKALYGLSVGFEAVTRPLQLLADLISGTTPVLTVFFEAIKIGGILLGRVAGKIGDFVKDLLGMVDLNPPTSGGFIGFIKNIAGAIADAVKQIDKLLSKGASLSQAFGSLSLPSLPSMPDMPSMPKMSMPAIGGGDAAKSQVSSLASGVKDLTKNVLGLGDAAKESTSEGLFSMSDVGSVLGKIGGFFVDIKDAISGALKNISMDDIVSSFNLAIFATMGIQIARFVATMRKSFEGFMGTGKAFNDLIGNAGTALKSFQTQARAKLILNIALALLILAGALWILSKIPADKLAKALTAMGALFVMMNITMKNFANSLKTTDGVIKSVNMVGMAVAIVLLAGAMILFATACLIMQKVDVKSIVKALAVMYVAMKLMESLGDQGKEASKNMIAGAAAIAIVSVSMTLLAGALLLFKLVDWGSMGKAGTALAGVALAVGLLALIPYEGIAKVGLALLATSVGMLAMANALIIFALVKWESIGKAAVTLTLLTIALAVLQSVGNPVAISGLLGMAGAMVLLAGALLLLNSVEWASIGKLAVVFTVLSVALLAFTGIMYLMAPVVPVVALFGVALLALGLGMLAFAGAMAIAITLGAAGVAAFAALATGAAVAIAVFLQTLAKEAPVMKKAFLDILQNLIDTIVEAVPMIINGIKRLWAAVKKEFTSGDKKKDTGAAGKSWIEKAADGIESKIPLIVKKASDLIITFLHALASKAGAIAGAGVEVVVAVINGISKKIGDISNAAVNLIIKFAAGIANGLNKIVDAGIDLVAGFLHKLADTIRNSGGKIGSGITDIIDAFHDLGVQMIQGIIDGVGDKFQDAENAIGNLAGGMVNKAKSILDIFSPSKVFRNIGKFLVLGLTQGVQINAQSAIVAVASMMQGTIAMASTLMDKALQKMDQQALAARAKAQGLQRAAEAAQKAANKTKGKDDDKAATKLSKEAKRADKAADKAERAEKAAEKKKQRDQEWENANSAKRAEIRSKQAQSQLLASKQAEQDAEAARVQANALDKQAKAKGLTEAQRKKFRKDADNLRDDAKADAIRANNLLAGARNNAAAAMEWQAKAGQEAADAFEAQFEDEAKAAADAEAFDKLTAAEKAAQRRKEATDMEAKAADELAKAKALAFTDLKAANDMANLALEDAQKARDLLDDAKSYEGEGGSGQVVSLAPTDSAAMAFNQYADLYDAAYAAAARTPTIEFTQNNTSPEALTPSQIYRQTNNLLTYAADKVSPAA